MSLVKNNKQVNKILAKNKNQNFFCHLYKNTQILINKVTIFDWDDTLLCTSYLGVLGFIDLQPEVTE